MNKLKHWLQSVAGIFLLCACGSRQSRVTKDAIQTYPVLILQSERAEVYADYPATIQGIQNVEIRPKIDGYLKEIYVDEGASVKKGQRLFRIDAPIYEENVKTAEANVKIAIADVNAAQMQVGKVKPLVEKDIISAYELESAQYSLQSKEAALAQARAALNNARTNLSFATVYSPVDGVIGILPYKIGSLVSSTTANPLTTVSNIERIYAYFSINERKGLDLFQSSKGGTIQQKLKTLPPVSLILANGNLLPHQGRVETASGLINTQTGSINMRATFPNPDGLVRSGSSAVVHIPQAIDSALLVPQKATYQIQGKLFVYILDAANKVGSVEITAGYSIGQNYVVTKGLQPGIRIVADGIGSLREGITINPQPVNLSGIIN